jgi:hypothetical protein
LGSAQPFLVSVKASELDFASFANPHSLFRYYLGTPEHYPGQQHLYRVSALPPKIGAPLIAPHCLTCLQDSTHVAYLTTQRSPIRLVTAWDDDWESAEQSQAATIPLPTQAPPSKKKKKKGSHNFYSYNMGTGLS